MASSSKVVAKKNNGKETKASKVVAKKNNGKQETTDSMVLAKKNNGKETTDSIVLAKKNGKESASKVVAKKNGKENRVSLIPNSTMKKKTPTLSTTVKDFIMKLFGRKKKKLITASDWHDIQFPPRPLPQYCSDLVVEQGNYVRFLDDEIGKALRHLKEGGNNVLLVCESKFGKVAVIQGMAREIHKKKIVCFNIGELKTKGSKEIMKIVTNTIRTLAGFDEDVVVFIDDIDFVFECAARENVSTFFNPMFGGRKIQCIGAATLGDFRRHIEKNDIVKDVFGHVFVLESSVAETKEILMDLRAIFEAKHGVRVENDSTFFHAVELSRRYLTEQRLPDKAITVVEQACKIVIKKLEDIPEEITKLKKEIVQLESELVYLKGGKAKDVSERLSDLRQALKNHLAWHERDKRNIEKIRKLRNMRKLDEETTLEESFPERILEMVMVKPEHVREVVSNLTGIPTQILCSTAKDKLCGLGDRLRRKVVGQAETITSVEHALRSIFNLNHRGYLHPYASFLFTGTPDVGQFETAKALAEELFDHAKFLLHFDMSEYKNDKDNLVKKLAAAVREKQYCVILLDNIEMGTETTTEVVTELLVRGSLIDSEKRKIDFSNTVIIMISREGEEVLEDSFRDRLDETLIFGFPSGGKIQFDEEPEERVQEMWRPLRLNDKAPIYDIDLNKENATSSNLVSEASYDEDDDDDYGSVASDNFEGSEDGDNDGSHKKVTHD